MNDWTNKVVKIKPEWLSPGEDPDTLYFVIEDRENRVLVGLLIPDPNDPFPGQWCWSKDCFLV